MRQGDARRWRVRGLPGFDRIFQTTTFRRRWAEFGVRKWLSLTLWGAVLPRNLFFLLPRLQSVRRSVCNIPRHGSLLLLFIPSPALLFIFYGQALNLPDHWLLGMFLSYFRVTFGDVLFPFLGESSVPRNRAEGVVLQPELELVTRVLLRFPFQRRKSLCCLLKTPLVKYSRSPSSQLYN